ncbi:hypothetical protein [Nocardia sp. NPDC019304]|uniref:hypothetical protein n=1 Tax=unclassified Nocardia TaxID=2637762 RepID=UPI0033D52A90
MTTKKGTPEQVALEFTKADRLLVEGKDVRRSVGELHITEATYFWWRNQFGGLQADDAAG